MSLPNTSREIKKLTERGFVYKYTDKKDRRKTYIQLTDTGTNLMNSVSTCMEERFSNSISNLSDAELKKIEASLECMSSLLLKRILDSK